MFKGLMTVIICISSSSLLFGGEAWNVKKFNIKSNPSTISQWLKEHPKEVARATGNEIVSKDGDNIRLMQDTPKGIIEFTVHEEFTNDKTVYNYNSNLIKVHQGPIEDQKTVVKISVVDGSTMVEIKLFAKVEDTASVSIKTKLHKSTKGFQELLERKFN